MKKEKIIKQQCLECMLWKEATEDNFYVRKDSENGVRRICISCSRKGAKKRQKDLREKRKGKRITHWNDTSIFC